MISMSHNQTIMEYDEYTTKIMNIQKTISDYNKKKYDIILETLKAISILFSKRIKYLSDFKNIPCILIQENFQDIKDILIKNKETLESNFDMKIKFSKSDDYKKIISFLRSMIRNIDYKMIIRNDYMTILHI